MTGETPCRMMLYLSGTPFAPLDKALDFDTMAERRFNDASWKKELPRVYKERK